jgi:hypothetical protein
MFGQLCAANGSTLQLLLHSVTQLLTGLAGYTCSAEQFVDFRATTLALIGLVVVLSS